MLTEAKRNGLIEEFMEDVPGIVEEMNDGSIPEEDLLQEGMVGLIEGVRAVDDNPDNWTGLSMEKQIHASIREAVQKALDDKRALDNEDGQLIVQVELLNRSIDKLTEELGTKPNLDEIANDLKISQEKVLQILKLTGEVTDEEKLMNPASEASEVKTIHRRRPPVE